MLASGCSLQHMPPYSFSDRSAAIPDHRKLPKRISASAPQPKILKQANARRPARDIEDPAPELPLAPRSRRDEAARHPRLCVSSERSAQNTCLIDHTTSQSIFPSLLRSNSTPTRSDDKQPLQEAAMVATHLKRQQCRKARRGAPNIALITLCPCQSTCT